MSEIGGFVVWLADDDAVRDSLQILLEIEGFTVRAFASGPTVLGAAEDDAADCLVLDVHMPEMNGFDVVRALRDMDVHFPTIFLTGLTDERLESRARPAGVHCVLAKPVAAEALVTEIHGAIVRA